MPPPPPGPLATSAALIAAPRPPGSSECRTRRGVLAAESAGTFTFERRFTPKPQEYTDPVTGEMKKKQMKFFPDTYKDRIGKSYNDYIADHQMNMFEDFIGYQGSAVLDEPVREEDSFSKESMSQESEISENILLPDLAKQSESIEQQSGEIAERGMPT